MAFENPIGNPLEPRNISDQHSPAAPIDRAEELAGAEVGVNPIGVPGDSFMSPIIGVDSAEPVENSPWPQRRHLSLVPNDFDDLFDAVEEQWQDRALCAQTDPEAFFPERAGPPARPSASARAARSSRNASSTRYTTTSGSASGAVSPSVSAAASSAASSEGPPVRSAGRTVGRSQLLRCHRVLFTVTAPITPARGRRCPHRRRGGSPPAAPGLRGRVPADRRHAWRGSPVVAETI